MNLTVMKEQTLNSFKYCIENNLFPKEYLVAKIALLPTTYDDITQEDIQPLLNMLTTEESTEQVVAAE